MIRVGSLYDQTFLPKPQIDNKTGMTAEEQLGKVFEATAPLYEKKDKIYKRVAERLTEKGITKVRIEQLQPQEKKFAEEYFYNYIQPILSPQIINAHHPFPHLINKGLYLVLCLKIRDKTVFGIVPVSYTHLDVYKRQDLSPCPFCCCSYLPVSMVIFLLLMSLILPKIWLFPHPVVKKTTHKRESTTKTRFSLLIFSLPIINLGLL